MCGFIYFDHYYNLKEYVFLFYYKNKEFTQKNYPKVSFVFVHINHIIILVVCVFRGINCCKFSRNWLSDLNKIIAIVSHTSNNMK